MLCHCQTLNVACQYTESEYVVSVLDYKREFGLWHGIQSTIFNGMHMIYVPYSIMKINPAIWLTTITKYKASVALVKSRDMHWGLMAQRDHKEINLSSLRILLVADGANPCKFLATRYYLSKYYKKKQIFVQRVIVVMWHILGRVPNERPQSRKHLSIRWLFRDPHSFN